MYIPRFAPLPDDNYCSYFVMALLFGNFNEKMEKQKRFVLVDRPFVVVLITFYAG